ncbi:EF-hand domain-containing protein [Aliiroseovarius sp. Z3]|uniref:EF-hand domain-containing protein n=1 Tax=Aliiroseovarius sp. Z3 TaxID=2811402 RepID=UPI0023B267E7|nr:EF-hand domain-containing protein [Aliiroseovarius sp. Z3]MDE9451235.1 EF-hand domain-containing protein [Aliiroseovarius sp. Z3]
MHKSSLLAAGIAIAVALPSFAQNQPGAHFLENWDLDENGSVTLEEAKERRGDIFTTFDTNEDDILTADEYVQFDEAREADMKENNIGQGSRQGKARNSQGMKQVMGEHGAAMSMTLENADLNGDGEVTREEFLAGVDPWFALQDRNGDKVLTTEDFARM